MIISHKYKFIFIKTGKTAGTSIEIALSSVCGAEDVITPVAPDCESIRTELGYAAPRNYRVPGRVERNPNDRDNMRFYNHMKAAEVRDLVGESIWQEYYTFCFERNPWDRAISAYYYNIPDPRPALKDFILSQYLSVFLDNFGIYSANGEVIVDHVARYEDLQNEMEKIVEHLGLPHMPELPRAKTNYRVDRRPYREILGEAERIAIERVCKPEIELLGYTF